MQPNLEGKVRKSFQEKNSLPKTGEWVEIICIEECESGGKVCGSSRYELSWVPALFNIIQRGPWVKATFVTSRKRGANPVANIAWLSTLILISFYIIPMSQVQQLLSMDWSPTHSKLLVGSGLLWESSEKFREQRPSELCMQPYAVAFFWLVWCSCDYQ